jgi:hypothetical protein
MKVIHERGLVNARREGIHEIEEEVDDEHDRLSRRNILKSVRSIIIG